MEIGNLNIINIDIMTTIGCTNNCKYCPQELVLKNYKSEIMNMSFEDFKTILNNIPKEINVAFSGFADDLKNKETYKFIKYTLEQGRKTFLFTTLTYNTREDIEKIVPLELDLIVLHLPDKDNYTNIRTDKEYMNNLKYLLENSKAKKISAITFGDYHTEIKRILGKRIKTKERIERFIESNLLKINRSHYLHSRGGNTNIFPKKSHTGKKLRCFTKIPVSWVTLPNGDVQICWSDFGQKHKIGNLKEQTWFEILESEKYREYIKEMQHSSDKILCNKCDQAREVRWLEDLFRNIFKNIFVREKK